MKLLYIANIRLPTEKAHGIQIMEMCHALASSGVRLELCVPVRKNNIKEDPFIFYGIHQNFKITFLSVPDTVRFGYLGFLFQSLFFGFRAMLYAVRRQYHVVYSRDIFPIFLLSFFNIRLAYEAHAPYWNFFVRHVLRNIHVFFPISNGLQDYYQKKGFISNKMVVLPDAVNLKNFFPYNKIEARKELGLPLDEKIVLYSGHLLRRKGVHVLADAHDLLPRGVRIIFVGGTEADVLLFKKHYEKKENILVLGHRSHAKIPLFLSSADVLVLPNISADEDASMYTSPMKLFEYMASGTPIIASDVSSLREVLTDENAYFFPPDRSDILAKIITEVLHDLAGSQKRTVRAHGDVAKYTWNHRAQTVIRILFQ